MARRVQPKPHIRFDKKTGRPYVYYRVDGGQVFRRFKTKGEAETFLHNAMLLKKQGQHPVQTKQTFQQFAADWLESHPSLRPRTRQLYDQRIRDYLNPVIGNLKVGEIDAYDVRRVVEYSRRHAVSGWTQ
jgi:Phage integrase, N-terminal SAM-like domain